MAAISVDLLGMLNGASAASSVVFRLEQPNELTAQLLRAGSSRARYG